jgi:hypothetical protein
MRLFAMLIVASCGGVPRAVNCTDDLGVDARALCDACASEPACVTLLERPSVDVVCSSGVASTVAPLWLAQYPGCLAILAEDTNECPTPVRPGVGAGWADQPVEPPDGAGIHEEREYTFATERTDDAEALMVELYAAAEAAIQEPERWQAPAAIGYDPVAGYGLSGEVEDDGTFDCCTSIAIVDTHLDDAAGQTLAAHGEYRVRFRFESIDDAGTFHADLADGVEPDEGDWPVRVEIQTKTGRVDLGGGLSSVIQSRLSLEAGFPPFLADDGICWGSAVPGACRLPLPAQPWDPRDYLAGALTGVFAFETGSGGFEQVVARPSVDLVDWHGAREGALAVAPTVTLVTARQRFHPTILFELGLGWPEPSDVYIVSLDDVSVVSGPAWHAWLEGAGPMPPTLATFRELDVEFEPDVAQRLDQAIAAGEGDLARLAAIEQAFLADLATWAGIFSAVIGGEPAVGNKYEIAVARAAFLRGDLDGDGAVGPADAAALLLHLYAGVAPPSPNAADVDDDGTVAEPDLLRLVTFLYAGGAAPPSPWPAPGMPCWEGVSGGPPPP